MDCTNTYTGALVKLLWLWNNRKIYNIHGIIEVKDYPCILSTNPRNLGLCWFYSISTILRSAHIIPATHGIYFINNYIDWDQYNTLYDPQFIAKEIQVANNIQHKYINRASQGNILGYSSILEQGSMLDQSNIKQLINKILLNFIIYSLKIVYKVN